LKTTVERSESSFVRNVSDRIVITGGAGFVGSHVVDHTLAARPDAELVVLDKMTYAADRRYLEAAIKSGRVKLIEADICDPQACARAFEGASLVINLAGESHVDTSFQVPFRFTQTNVVGTHQVVQAVRDAGVPTLVHISTDEVYGQIREGFLSEDASLHPTTPYSASKAAGEMMLSSYLHSYGMDIRIIRSNNIIGTRQYPEKLLPRFICRALSGEALTIHGAGNQRRTFVTTADFCRAVETVIRHGKPGATYNVGTEEEYTVREIADLVAANVADGNSTKIVHVEDRVFNDCRYGVDASRLAALGWKPGGS